MIAAALAFLAPYRLLVIGLAILSAVVFIDRRATYRERAKCDAAALRSKLVAKETDLKAASDAAEIANRARAESEAAAEDDRKRIAEYETELKTRVGGACPLTDNDIGRLHGRSVAKPR